MKSTKSIFVVALAALMLVAFTACNQTPTWGDNEVANVTVVSADKFYAGSTEKTGNAVVTVERVGGKTTENVAAKIEITGNSIVPGTNAAKVSYGEEGTKASTWMTTVEALSVTELEIKYTEPTGPIGSKEELAVDAVYGIYSDGTKTGNIIASVSSDFNEDKTAIVFTLSSTYNYSSETVSASVDVEFKEDPAPEVVGIEVRYSVNDADPVSTLPTLYSGDEVEVLVYEKYKGDTPTYAETTQPVSFVNMTTGTAPVSGSTFTVVTSTAAGVSPAVTTTAAGTVRVTIDGKIYQAKFSIGSGASYFTVSGLVVKYADGKSSIEPGHTFAETDVTPTVIWTGTEGTPSITYVFDETAVPSGYTGIFSTLCTAAWTEKGESKTLTVPLSFSVAE